MVCVGGGVVSRVLTLATLGILWVGAVRLIIGAVPAGPVLGRMRARVGWVVACAAAFAAGVLAWSPGRW